MADNTLQWQWIVIIKDGLEVAFADDPDVFVAGNLLWYPVEGDNTVFGAPDVLTAFGRPKGYRGSYMQWREGDVPPQVVWEILSPSDRRGEMERKFEFYQRYGVEEYYLYDPARNALRGWRREGDLLREIENMNGWVSPRLGIRFELVGRELRIYDSDGRRFSTYVDVVARLEASERQNDRERQEKFLAQERAELERREKELAREMLDQARREKEAAQRFADEQRHATEQLALRAEKERLAKEEAQRRADEERVAKERLIAKLRELGIDPEL